VFRIYDTRTGRLEEVGPVPGRLLRLYARAPAQRPAHAGELRTLLVADLIRRNAEHRHGLTVLASLVMPGAGNEGAASANDAVTGADAGALNVRPADQTARNPERAGSPGGAVGPGEIIIEVQPGPEDGHATVWHSVRVGPVTFAARSDDARSDDARSDDSASSAELSALADRGLDPLALRLALMSCHHAEPANLTWGVLTDADLALRRWRELVAEWAESPSRPMCAEVTSQVAAAFDGDLDTPTALRALRALENDPQIPPGSKFESFLHADQLLALDLPREIGRQRRG